jgi:hypothetical protein
MIFTRQLQGSKQHPEHHENVPLPFPPISNRFCSPINNNNGQQPPLLLLLFRTSSSNSLSSSTRLQIFVSSRVPRAHHFLLLNRRQLIRHSATWLHANGCSTSTAVPRASAVSTAGELLLIRRPPIIIGSRLLFQ